MSRSLRALDLFSGIGGFSLGLERAGMKTVAFCEIDPFCRRVLAKHWPEVPCYDDVRTLTAERLRADGIVPDVICGGFPCQDISTAGKGAGITGERSGLWSEYARLIGEIRPRYVIVENVAALLGRGLGKVLGDLAALGFDAEWHCIPASAVGAPHRRDRVWIIATDATGGRHGRHGLGAARERQPARAITALAYAAGERCGETGEHRRGYSERTPVCGEVLADATSAGLERRNESATARRPQPVLASCGRADIPNADSEQTRRLAIAWGECGQWLTEPDVGRVAHGIPSRVDRLRSLGNAVVPQIPEIIGRAIIAQMQVAA